MVWVFVTAAPSDGLNVRIRGCSRLNPPMTCAKRRAAAVRSVQAALLTFGLAASVGVSFGHRVHLCPAATFLEGFERRSVSLIDL